MHGPTDPSQQDAPAPLPEQGAAFATQIPSLKERFYFHQLIKESAINRHYIVEDISNLAEQTSPVFYYLKQTRYQSAEEYQHAKWFYKKFHNYCHSPFAKTDITKLQFVFNFDEPESRYFELVSVFEYGDSDRIDVESIEPDQILRFLRNICLLLSEVQKFDGIPHGNVFLKNMVLTNSELKLSGFKPVLLGEGSLYRSWKLALARQVGAVRLDLFLVGVMWLRFLGVDLGKSTRPELPAEKVVRGALKRAQRIASTPKQELLVSLLDVGEQPVLSIESVILDFDEHFVLEDIKAEQRRKSEGPAPNVGQNSTSFSHANFTNQAENSARGSNLFDSEDPLKIIKKSESKLSNPFVRAYKDSEQDLSSRRDDRDRRITFENQSQRQANPANNSEFHIQEGEYSLKPKESHLDENASRRAKEDPQSFTELDFETEPFKNSLAEGRASRPGQKPEERYSSLDYSKDSGARANGKDGSGANLEESRRVALDDLADAKRISFRSKTFNEGDVSLRDSLRGGLKKESQASHFLLQNSQHSKFNSKRSSEQDRESLRQSGLLLRNSGVEEPRFPSQKQSLQQERIAEAPQQIKTGIEGRQSKKSLENKGTGERESLKGASSLSKKTSVKSIGQNQKGSIVAQEAENKLFGNKNSVSKQVLARESLKKREESLGQRAESIKDFRKKSPENVEEDHFLPRNSKSIKESHNSKEDFHRNSFAINEDIFAGNSDNNRLSQPQLRTEDEIPQKISFAHREEDRHSEARKRSQSPSNPTEQLPKRSSQEPTRPSLGLFNNKAETDNDRNESNRRSIPKQDPIHRQSSADKKNSDHRLPNYPQEHETPEEIRRGSSKDKQVKNSSQERNLSSEEEKQARPSNSPARLSLHDQINFRVAHPVEERRIEIQTVTPSILLSEAFEQRQINPDGGKISGPKHYTFHGQKQSESRSPLLEYQDQNILDKKLTKPSKAVFENLQKAKPTESRTFSNLDPKVVAKSPARRNNNDLEEESNPALRMLRAKIRDALKAELPEHKKQEVIAKIRRDHEEKTSRRLLKEAENRDRVALLALNQRLIDKELDYRLKRLAEEKLEQKRQTNSFEKQQREAIERVSDIRLLEQDYAPVKLLTKALQGNFESVHGPAEGTVDVKKFSSFADAPSKSAEKRAPVRQRPFRVRSRSPLEKPSLESINKEIQRQLRHSPIPQRDKFFSYNHEHEVLKVPFRKVVENFHKNEPESEAEALRRTKSHSLMMHDLSAPDFAGLRPAVQTNEQSQAGRGRAESDFDVKFFYNKTKLEMQEQLQAVPIFDTLKPSDDKEKIRSQHEKTNSLSPAKDQENKAKPDQLAENTNGLFSFKEQDFYLMHERPELLLNELKAFTVFSPQNAFNIPDDAVAAFPELVEKIAAIKSLFEQGDLEECRKQLDGLGVKSRGLGQIQALKLLSFIFFSQKDVEKAKACLLEALRILKQEKDLKDKELYFSFVAINLAFLEFYCLDFQEAIKILNNAVFESPANRPFFYYSFLGACHYLAGEFPKARFYFNEQLKGEFNGGPIDVIQADKFFQLVSKVLNCFGAEQEKVEPARFFQSIEAPLLRLKSELQGPESKAEAGLKSLGQRVVFRFLAFGKETANNGLLNFVLQRTLEKKLFDPVADLSEEQKTSLCAHLLEVCAYLKAKKNYGKFEKNFARYLDCAKKVINACDLNAENLRTNLLVLFQKGLYCLQSGDQKKAHVCFDKCIRLYNTFFEGNNPEIFQMLFEIGLSIVRMRRFEEAAFFFEKIIGLTGSNYHLKLEARRQLGKAYFWLKQFDKCRKIFGEYFEEAIFKHDAISAGQKIFKDLCLYFIANAKTKSADFQRTFDTLVNLMLFGPRVAVVRYLELFRYFEGPRLGSQTPAFLERVWNDLGSVLLDSSLSPEDAFIKLVAFSTTFYSQIKKPKGQEAGTDLTLLRLAKDKDLGLEANAKVVAHFVLNLALLVLQQLPAFGPGSASPESKEQQLERLMSLRRLEGKVAIMKELLAKVEGSSAESLGPSIERLSKSKRRGEQPAPTRSPSRILALGKTATLTPVEIAAIIAEADIDKEFCPCSKIDESLYGVFMLIQQFLLQIKNMQFLDVAENVGEYYKKFLVITKEKNWNWCRCKFVKLLFDFLVEHEHEAKAKANVATFVRVLDEVFADSKLCLHDLNIIVMLVESFKNPDYVELLVMFLDKCHPKYAAFVFNLIFLRNFNNKHEQIVSSFYKKVYSYRFHNLENFSLMHVIGVENLLQIEKDLGFRIYVRYRYDVLADVKYRELFLKYISETRLKEFYLKYAIYRTLVALVKKEAENQFEIVQHFQDKLANFDREYKLVESSTSLYLYDIYLLVNLLDFKADARLPALTVQTLRFLASRLSAEQRFHFAVLSSLVGNHFCKLRLFEASAEAKMAALSAMKELMPGPIVFPPFVIAVDPKSLIFSVIAFLLVDYLEMNKLEEAEVFFYKILDFKYESGKLDLEKLLLNVLFEMRIGEFKGAKETLELALKLFGKMQLNEFLANMFKATMDRFAYLIAKKANDQQEIERKRQVSEGSVKKLLEHH